MVSRYFVLGIFSTLVDYVIYSFLIFFEINYILALVVGYGVGIVFNYYYGKRFVFINGSKIACQKKEFLSVATISIIGMALSVLIVYILSEYFTLLNYYYARVVAIVVVFFYNYYARKIFVYL